MLSICTQLSHLLLQLAHQRNLSLQSLNRLTRSSSPGLSIIPQALVLIPKIVYGVCLGLQRLDPRLCRGNLSFGLRANSGSLMLGQFNHFKGGLFSICELVCLFSCRIKNRSRLVLNRGRLDSNQLSVVAGTLENRLGLFLCGRRGRSPKINGLSLRCEFRPNLSSLDLRRLKDHLRLVLCVIDFLDLFPRSSSLLPHACNIGHRCGSQV